MRQQRGTWNSFEKELFSVCIILNKPEGDQSKFGIYIKESQKLQNPEAETRLKPQAAITKNGKIGKKKWDWRKKKKTYSRELVACVADKHASLANSTITHRHTLDEPGSTGSHWKGKEARKKRRKGWNNSININPKKKKWRNLWVVVYRFIKNEEITGGW